MLAFSQVGNYELDFRTRVAKRRSRVDDHLGVRTAIGKMLVRQHADFHETVLLHHARWE